MGFDLAWILLGRQRIAWDVAPTGAGRRGMGCGSGPTVGRHGPPHATQTACGGGTNRFRPHTTIARPLPHAASQLAKSAASWRRWYPPSIARPRMHTNHSSPILRMVITAQALPNPHRRWSRRPWPQRPLQPLRALRQWLRAGPPRRASSPCPRRRSCGPGREARP